MRQLLLRILAYVRQVLQIADVVDQDAVIAFVKADIDIRGAKAWILVFAIFTASLGLNTNSAAVIIGAMLISPLMGPIIGVGVGLGISDGPLLSRSARNLATMLVISLITSTLYFVISPFDDAASEILARTSPTLLDALIALAGGAAGAVAIVRQDRSNVVPGVAIATALMPPLCTAGYGLAQLQFTYFIGAFYLFFINTVCIMASTYAVVRIMKFHQVVGSDPAKQARVRRYVAIVVAITLVPSIVIGWFILQQNRFEREVHQFVAKASDRYNATSFVVSKAEWHRDTSQLVITVVGPALSPDQLTEVRSLAAANGLTNTNLDIRQAGGLSSEFMSLATENMRKGVVGDLFDRSVDELRRKDSVIAALRLRTQSIQATEGLSVDLTREAVQIYPNLRTLSYVNPMYVNSRDGRVDTQAVAFVSFDKRPSSSELTAMQHWLSVRVKHDSVVVKVVQ